MEIKILKPRKAINKAFLKIKPHRQEIENFKTNLIQLLDRTNNTESEEFHKNLVSDFLKKTYYEPNHFINTKGRNDLVIHNGNKAKSTVGVIIEAKKPTNKTEMLTKSKINVKAFQELVLYYLRERITHKNIEIKYLVATNINEWFIFDSNVFEKQFAQNKGLVKQFNDFENGRLAGKTTDFFYKEIAEPFIHDLKQDIEFTFFDIREYEKPLRNDNPKDDNRLISLFKLLSPEHLLKLPFANDSNSLDKRFYGELLHIIGLSEIKDGGKKLIQRNKKGERNTGSFLENAIIQLDSLDKINRLDNPSHFGTTIEERLFNVGLELSITWINRILFLKLLEAQLKTYHKGDKSYEFLSIDKIKNYDDLNSLFFQVLAKQQSERNEDVTELFSKIPYLNSSLFEPTAIEHGTLFISNLSDDKTIPIYASTVLKSDNGKKLIGNLSALEYLFEFLNAYDFSSEGSEEIQEDNKTLINASVLGLIFEKINGYKDGSFFTPGFITMYMCRETIRKAVVQKFNETKSWNCKDIDALYDKIEDRQEANNIINSLKICDPAVGSGHFLVSALNEMIAIKNDLKILQDRDGKRLKEYLFEVVNDELIVTDEDGELFEYNPNNKERQRIQETLFHEKQTIIENCLFGVDINPNSVKICQLRLWIELLKNAYYKNESELETLPNIDINIKCGNSLINRFTLDSDLTKTLRKSKISITEYREAVKTYMNAENKEQKNEMKSLIKKIKKDFKSTFYTNIKENKDLANYRGQLINLQTANIDLFGTKLNKSRVAIETKRLKKLIEQQEKKVAEIISNKIYEEAFEWRFEFPEVLDDNGNFVGFDVVIGNPPYIRVQELPYDEIDYYKRNFEVALKRVDISILFIELSKQILKKNYYCVYITSNQFLSTEYGEAAREYLLKNYSLLQIVDFGDAPVFEEALTYVSIFIFHKSKPKNFIYTPVNKDKLLQFEDELKFYEIEIDKLTNKSWVLKNKEESNIIIKLNKFQKLSTIGNCWAGLFTGLDKVLMFEKEDINELEIERDLLLPVIRAQDCERFKCNEASKLVLYPYKVYDDKTVLLKESELQNKYPLAYEYLNKNKSLLSKRKDSRKSLDKDGSWYKLTRFGQRQVFNKPKIVSPGEVKNHKFSIDQSNSGFSCARVFAITVDNANISLNKLVAILNSTLIKFYLQSKASAKAGGYYSYSSKVLNDTPIPNFKILNSSELEDKSVVLQNFIKANPDEDTSVLESEIDQLVYKLYNLTKAEIKIIEEAYA